MISSSPELHSLRYNVTVLSRDGSVQSGFLAEGHLDGQPFLLYDRQKRRARPQGQWAEDVLGAKTWDTETGDLTENGKDLRMTLAHIKGQKGGESGQRGEAFSRKVRGREQGPVFPLNLARARGDKWGSVDLSREVSRHSTHTGRHGGGPGRGTPWAEFLTSVER